MQRYCKISICMWVVGVCLLIVSVGMLLGFPSLFKSLVKKKMVLSADSTSYEYWQTIMLPVYHQLYFFNVTNPDEITKHGQKPILQEVGPYVYREHLIKENITWNSNGTVTYVEKHVYVYQQNMTKLHEEDVIVTINAPLLTLAKTLDNSSILEKLLADLAVTLLLKKETLFVRHSIKELAFGGYHDIIVALASVFEKNPPFPGNTFGWFYPQNNSNDGLYVVETGSNDISKFLWVDKWQHERTLQFWNGSYCNEIKGPIPELFSPESYSDTLDMFVTDMCRSVALKYDSDVMVHGDVKSRRYLMPNSTLASSSANECFCNGPCYPSGVLDTSVCHGGAPVALSLPHFYMADPQLVKDVEGLKPEKKKHQFYWDVEPVTGMTSEFAARLQINIQLKRYTWLDELSNAPNVLFPVLWIDKVGIMSDYVANKLLAVSARPQRIANISCYTVLAVSLLILLITTIVFVVFKKRDNGSDKVPLIIDDKLDDDSPPDM